MADVAVETNLHIVVDRKLVRVGPIWTDPDTGYVFFVNVETRLRYRKTTDGGATWGSDVQINQNLTGLVDIWFDRWTPDDSGTDIHIWYIDYSRDDCLYRSLDTSTDTLSIERTIFAGVSANQHRIDSGLSGTKAVDGNLYVQIWLDHLGERRFSRSTNGGVSWSTRASGDDGFASDHVLMYPDAMSADSQDVVMIYWDRSANEISIKKYDNSANSWSEAVISTAMNDDPELLQMDAVLRHTDGHIILVAWTRFNSGAANLKCWDINVSTPSVVEKTNVITTADDCVGVALFINQINDTLYCTYIGQNDGAQTFGVLDVHYKSSTDGGVTWSGETTYAETAADVRLVSAGHSTPGNAAGRFQPAFTQRNAATLYINTNNDIELPLGVTIPLPLRNKRLQSMADHPAMI